MLISYQEGKEVREGRKYIAMIDLPDWIQDFESLLD
jgi:hypothetical protein